LDGTVGTLHTLERSSKPSAYYFTSKEELKLFDFASSLLVDTEIQRRLAKVVASKTTNLQKLELCHIGHLLQQRPVGALTLTPSDLKTDEWLVEFWEYFNGLSQATPSSSTSEIDDFPALLRAVRGTSSFYVSPPQLHVLPAVVEPSLIKHQQLCDQFPQLVRFASDLMPRALKRNEESFNSGASFLRFLKALKSLSAVENKSLPQFVQEALSHEDLKVPNYLSQ